MAGVELNSLQAFQSYVGVTASYDDNIEPISNGPDTNGFVDDFEVLHVSDGSDDDHHSSVSSLVSAAFDPQAIFDLVQKEHNEAKAKLEEQKELLVAQRERQKKFEEESKLQIEELTQKVHKLEGEIGCRDKLLSDKDGELKIYKGLSEQTDELTAKLCRAEDTIKYQDQIIRQSVENLGFVEINPQLLTDRFLANEINEKDNELENLRQELSNMHAELLKREDNETKLNRELDEIKNLNAALQNQVQLDEADILEIRREHLEEKQVLLAEIRQLQGEPDETSFRSSSGEHNNTSTITEDSDLQRSPSQRNNSQSSGGGQYRCPYCQLLLPDGDELANHRMSTCPQYVVDNLF